MIIQRILTVLGFVFLSFSTLFALSDKYRCMWRDDPATTMVIGWNQITGENPIVYYDEVNKGANPLNYTKKQTPNYIIAAQGMRNHFVRLSNLKPSTTYYFIISDSKTTSRLLSFETAPATPNERLSIIAGGDSRNHREARRKANLLVGKLRPHAVLFAGDMTGGATSEQWQQWLNDWQLTIAPDGRMTPILVARGNHEPDNETLVNLFDVPSPMVYYALTLGGNLLRTYTLNSMIPSGASQRTWLEKDLQQNSDVIWKIAQYHHSIRPHSKVKDEKLELYKNWATLFYEHSVNVVVESDAHVVKWTYPIRPSREPGSEEGFIRDDLNGTVYVGEGCWGAPLRTNDDNKSWTRNSGRFNQFKWLWIDENRIEIRTVMTDAGEKTMPLATNKKFELPLGIKLWQPSNGSVVTIEKTIVEEPPIAVVANEPPPRTSTPKPPRPVPKKQLPKLYVDLNSGQIQVRYKMPREGEVEMILLDNSMQRIKTTTYLHVNGGTFLEPFDMLNISNGQYRLVLKLGSEVIGVYDVVKR